MVSACYRCAEGPMELIAFGVCQACAELYPSSRGCPSCDDDQVSAQMVADARCMAHAAESPPTARHRRRRHRSGLRRAQHVAIAAGFCFTVVLGTVLLLAA